MVLILKKKKYKHSGEQGAKQPPSLVWKWANYQAMESLIKSTHN